MPARPPHERLLLATYFTFGWIFVVIFLPVFKATTDLAVIAALGVVGVASALAIVSLVSLAVDRRVPPMRDFPNLDIGEDCLIAAVVTGIAVFLVSLVVVSFLPGTAPRLVTTGLLTAPFWAAMMAFLIKARPASDAGDDFVPSIRVPAGTVGARKAGAARAGRRR